MGNSFLVLLAFMFVSGTVSAAPRSLAVIGDSTVVGSLTHPDFAYDLNKLVDFVEKGPYKPDATIYTASVQKAVLGKEKDLPRANRVWESTDEQPNLPFNKRLEKQLEITAKSSLLGGFIDFPEYSWPYLVGRAQGIEGKQIYVVGEAGTRAGDTLTQVKRLLLATKKKLPDQIFIFWTGNNLCSATLKDDKPEDQKKRFFDDVMKGINELADKGTGEKDKTVHVFIPGYIQVSQLIAEKAVLEKSVYAFGKKRTCEEFRAYDPGMDDARATIKNQTILTAMKAYKDIKNLPPVHELCRSVLKVKKDDKASIAQIDALVKAYRTAAKDAVKKGNELNKTGIQFHYLDSTESFFADSDEIAADCFHPSERGNEKIAKGILTELKTKLFIDDFQF